MANLRVKWIFCRDEIQYLYRIVRIMWERGQPGRPGGGYSAKFTVALRPALFSRIERDSRTDWRVTILGIRLHYCRSYGGVFA